MQITCNSASSNRFPWAGRRVWGSKAGSALLVALAFVMLLTGLMLAFFSRSILEEQVSSSSANQIKVDNMAMGAVAATISDLKQEIEAGSGSNPPLYPVASNYKNFYYTPSAATCMIPSVTGGTAVTGTAPGSTFGSGQIAKGALLNVIKVSMHGQAFYPSSGANYTGGGLTDPTRAAAVSTGLTTGDSTGSAAPGSVSGTSLNGRYMTGTRWNKPLFVAPTLGSGGLTFPLPDWIYLARGVTGLGTINPTAWSTTLITTNTMSTVTTVVGRYAYVIYDEGSLLDVNVAGTPTPLASPNASSAYKSAAAMADLTQVGLTQTQVDTLVGWRNYASASQIPGGTSTALSGNINAGYTWASANATNYFLNVSTNPTGFLRPLSAWTSTTTVSQSDQFFTSRQQLLQFFTNVLGGGTTVNSALQYLTHFSRSIEQPSYVPSAAKVTAAPTAVIASGGNDLATSTAGAAEAAINPSFLNCRVPATPSLTRNDGSTAIVNDPLVKKRFALSRLAWLTYLGPIADDNGNYNAATGISALVTILKSYGYTDAFLKQGGPTNIYKYFGLVWLTDNRATIGDSQSKWYYNHESLTAPSSISSTAAHIRTLSSGTSTVASLGREADFFELLKASTCLGTLGKAYGTSTTSIGNFNINNPDPIAYQAALDNSTDRSVLQMGANIIDQFQPSGYCARILFYDGTFSYPLEVRGVEDMPYFYRVRQGEVMSADASPTPQGSLPSSTVTETVNGPGGVGSGKGVVMWQPEIWNPHALNTSNPDTNPRPTSFRIVAVGNSPNNLSGSGTSSVSTPIDAETGWTWYFTGTEPGATSKIVANDTFASLTEANAAMTFNIPSGDLYLFREPTLLIKPGIPTNSSLASVGATVTGQYSAAQYSQSGLTDSKSYIGFNIVSLPMAWYGTIPQQSADGTNPNTTQPGWIPTGYVTYTGGPPGITYRMQYQNGSGNWVTYDEKYVPEFPPESWNTPVGGYIGANKSFGPENATSTVADCNIGSYGSFLAVDPRTSRFGMTYAGCNGRGLTSFAFPLGDTINNPGLTAQNYYSGWAAPVGSAANSAAVADAAQQSAIWTVRPDENRGGTFSSYDGQALSFGYNEGPTGGTTPQANGLLLSAYGGWYPIPTVATSTGTSYGSSAIMQPGLWVQNNPSVVNATSKLRFAGDNQNPLGVFNHFYADADGVVRRGMSAYVPVASGVNAPATSPSAASQPSGLPTKEMMDYTQSPPAPNSSTNENQSRPIMLNRPFRSVADLDYVFSGTPWKNVDMSTPESGYAALLDVFCINDTDDQNGLAAGKVNLNTRQLPVLQAVLNGAYTDEFKPVATTGNALPLSSTYATDIGQALINRTTGTATGLGPLTNLSELVGKWNTSSTSNSSPSINGGSSFIGFTSDPVNSLNTSTAMYDLTQALTLASGSSDNANTRIERFRDASIRALANAGQTRVWNVMIDLVAQTGRFPTSATTLANFYVEGEQRYWIHLAIDRFTGQVIDQQIEVVKE